MFCPGVITGPFFSKWLFIPFDCHHLPGVLTNFLTIFCIESWFRFGKNNNVIKTTIFMNDSFIVKWNEAEVGEISNIRNDMWYLDGVWNSYETSSSQSFEKELKEFDTSGFLKDPTKALRVTLTNKNDSANILYCLALLLEDKSISLRQVVAEEALKIFFNK